MKNYNKLIISLIAIILIIIVMVVLIIINLEKNKTEEIEEDNNELGYVYDTKTLVTSDSSFYSVSNHIKKYYRYLGLDIEGKNSVTSEMLSIVGVSTQNEKKQILLNMLDTEYKETNNITIDNIYSFTGDYGANFTYTPLKMNVMSNGNMEQYSVYGRLIKEEDSGIQTAYTYIILNRDIINSTFSIELIDNSSYNDIDEIELKVKEENIEKNDNNKFTLSSRSDSEKAMQLLNMYKEDAKYDKERAYNSLDREYREARFESLENYKEYTNEYSSYIQSCNFSQYTVSKESGYTQYVCTDNRGNYYIFRETAIMQYTLLLDTYTIDIPEFTNTYNSSTEQEKVALNINKFIQSINAKDYKYAYNILATSFKNNNFKTQDEFEDYVENNFYNINTIELLEYSTQGSNHTYTAYLKSKIGGKYKKINFVMQLKDGTDFIMSFSIE